MVGGQDEDMTFARDTSPTGQCVQRRKLRLRAQAATLKEIANSKLRRLLAHNSFFNCPEIDWGDSVMFYKAQSRRSSPRWRGPAKILDIDVAGVTVPFQSRTFKVARYCVRKRVKETQATDEEWKNSLRRGGPWIDSLPGDSGLAPALTDGLNDNIEMADSDKPTDSGDPSTAEPDEPVTASPRVIPVPDSPSHSDQVPPEMLPDDRSCAPSQAPRCESANYDLFSSDQSHEARK